MSSLLLLLSKAIPTTKIATESTMCDIVTINPADVHSCNPKGNTWSYSLLFVDPLKMGENQREVIQPSRPSHCDD